MLHYGRLKQSQFVDRVRNFRSGHKAAQIAVQAVGMLPKLVELSIGDHVFSENLLSRQPLNDGVVSGLTALTRLTSLDVSRQWLTKDQIVLLADKLHNLR